MITIIGITQPIDISMLSGLQQEIILAKESSTVDYRYASLDHLLFELKFRSEMVAGSRELLKSKAQFAVFKKSRCNEQFWWRLDNGGFQLKHNVTPASAIMDIFANGTLYAFECATAMVIVMYRAVLRCIGETRFNRWFANLFLMDWQYDKDLGLITVSDSLESFIGDVLYFKNPDVSPETPQWQGENTVKLGNDLHYGHGIGITDSAGIIAVLNRYRRRGSLVSAYQTNQVSYPDFLSLWKKSIAPATGGDFGYPYGRVIVNRYIAAQIGSARYIL